MIQAWEFIFDLWETGNWWARAAITFVVVPPLVALVFALVGYRAIAAATALTPLFVLVFAPLALIDPMVVGVAAGALGLHPTAAAIRQWLVRWMSRYLGSTMAYAVYLYFVPIGNNPWLVLPLIGAVGAAALFAVGNVRRVAKFSAAIAVGITVAFFLSSWFGWFGGKKEVRAEAAATAQAEPPVPEFTIKAGEEIDTVETGPGTRHRYSADSEWILVSAVPEGVECPQRRPDGLCEFRMNPRGRIDGTSAAGPARVMGVAPTMTIRFEKVSR